MEGSAGAAGSASSDGAVSRTRVYSTASTSTIGLSSPRRGASDSAEPACGASSGASSVSGCASCALDAGAVASFSAAAGAACEEACSCSADEEATVGISSVLTGAVSSTAPPVAGAGVGVVGAEVGRAVALASFEAAVPSAVPVESAAAVGTAALFAPVDRFAGEEAPFELEVLLAGEEVLDEEVLLTVPVLFAAPELFAVVDGADVAEVLFEAVLFDVVPFEAVPESLDVVPLDEVEREPVPAELDVPRCAAAPLEVVEASAAVPAPEPLASAPPEEFPAPERFAVDELPERPAVRPRRSAAARAMPVARSRAPPRWGASSEETFSPEKNMSTGRELAGDEPPSG